MRVGPAHDPSGTTGAGDGSGETARRAARRVNTHAPAQPTKGKVQRVLRKAKERERTSQIQTTHRPPPYRVSRSWSRAYFPSGIPYAMVAVVRKPSSLATLTITPAEATTRALRGR